MKITKNGMLKNPEIAKINHKCLNYQRIHKDILSKSETEEIKEDRFNCTKKYHQKIKANDNSEKYIYNTYDQKKTILQM